MVELKVLKPEAVSAALDQAKHYRLLNEPDEAESICLDILATIPDQQDAMVVLLLSLTDKFAHGAINPSFGQAMEILERLDDSHCLSYYEGIIFERRAKHHLHQGGPGADAIAYEWFAKALGSYNETMEDCNSEAQKAVLRYNSCARVINSNPDVKADDSDRSEMLLDSFDTPH